MYTYLVIKVNVENALCCPLLRLNLLSTKSNEVTLYSMIYELNVAMRCIFLENNYIKITKLVKAERKCTVWQNN